MQDEQNLTLTDAVSRYFSLSELHDLCFRLSIRPDDLAGETITRKANELVFWLHQRGRLDELRRECKTLRPRVNWKDIIYVVPSSKTDTFRPSFQLPRRADYFTNQEKELNQVLSDLRDGRPVTLCGIGGIGKTALATEALYILQEKRELRMLFPDGVIYHNFYHQPHVEVVMEQIAMYFDRKPFPTPLSAAKQALADRHVLLFLDGAEASDDLHILLEISGVASLLVTSRNKYNAVTTFYSIPSLKWPRAVELLRKWGEHWVDDPAVARDICQTVGGLPLAIRLIGRYLQQSEQKATEYLQWLQSTPLQALSFGKRQRESITFLFERSLAQFSDGEINVLTIIGQLALAPFRIEVIAAGMANEAHTARDFLGQLINFGFVQRVDDDYQITHPLLHTYAHQQLRDVIVIQERLVTYYYEYVQEVLQQKSMGLQKIDAERPHLINLLRQLQQTEQSLAITTLAKVIDKYLDLRGFSIERIEINLMALAAAKMIQNPKSEEFWQGNLGNAYHYVGEHEKAINYLHQALKLSKQSGHGDRVDRWHSTLGNVYRYLGDYKQALYHHDQALKIAVQLGDKKSTGKWLGNLGYMYSVLGNDQKGLDFLQKALAIAEETDDTVGLGHRLGGLGNIYMRQGNFEKALSCLEKALELARQLGQQRAIGRRLFALGRLRDRLGLIEQANGNYKEALDIAETINDQVIIASCMRRLGNHLANKGQIQDAIEMYEQALAINNHIGHRRSRANLLRGLGKTHLFAGNFEQAISLYEEAQTIAQAGEFTSTEQLCKTGLGDCFLAQRNYDAAQTEYASGIRLLTGTEALLRMKMAQTYLYSDQLQPALKEIEFACLDKSFPLVTPQFFTIKGIILANLDRKKDAKESFNQAIISFQKLPKGTINSYLLVRYIFGIACLGLAFSTTEQEEKKLLFARANKIFKLPDNLENNLAGLIVLTQDLLQALKSGYLSETFEVNI